MLASNDSLQIVIKAWETFQSLARLNGEMAWKVRIWGISIWCALIAYGFKEQQQFIAFIALLEIVVIFLIEIGIRQVQYQYIEKSIEIESTLNSLLVGDEMELPERGISTNIDTPTYGDLLALLKIKRWLIWLPYVLLFLFTLIAFDLY